MIIWKRLIALFRRSPKTDTWADPQFSRDDLDRRARDAERIADRMVKKLNRPSGHHAASRW
jgi:hypothetical protein